MTTGSQSDFARAYGYSKAAITQFKQADRLVFTATGQVDFEASKARIKETADPNRADVARRHAETRERVIAAADLDADGDIDATGGATYQESRAKKEKYLALQAKVDYERSVGDLAERAEVERDWASVGVILRTSLERIPESMSAELAAETDENRIHAMLIEQIESILKQAADQINNLR